MSTIPEPGEVGEGAKRGGGAVALVLAGGGARGAYELGALSVLLPALEARGERPRIYVGTSIGALNAAWLAGTAHLDVAEVIESGEEIWRGVGFRDISASLVSPRSLWRLGRAFAGLPRKGVSLGSILDPRPMQATVRRIIDFASIKTNLAAGHFDALAVAATSARTSRPVVFHSGGGDPGPDQRRGIEYVAGPVTDEHVIASAAIPAFFPAAAVTEPAVAAGYYWDGGVRLNTPIKPALELGAERVVVIGLDSIEATPGPLADDRRPDFVEGFQQFLGAAFTQPLLDDMRLLMERNEEIAGEESKRVPYIFVGPERLEQIGEIAAEVWEEGWGKFRRLFTSPDLAILGRSIAASSDARNGAVASYLLFTPEFTDRLLELGRDDAKRWLVAEHDDGPWEWGSQLR